MFYCYKEVKNDWELIEYFGSIQKKDNHLSLIPSTLFHMKNQNKTAQNFSVIIIISIIEPDNIVSDYNNYFIYL